MISIRFEAPDQADVRALIDALDAYQIPLYPIESHHGIDLAALSQPHVHFAVARDAAGRAVACGAIVVGSDFAEIKRMFVRPEARGQGIGSALLRTLETQAARLGQPRMTLETGVRQPEAIQLYERAGYRQIAPFGSYANDPLSVFMEKRLT